jgi:hypothetical protein
MYNNLAQWKIKHQQLNHTQYTKFNAQITCSAFNTISEQWAPVPGKMVIDDFRGFANGLIFHGFFQKKKIRQFPFFLKTIRPNSIE